MTGSEVRRQGDTPIADTITWELLHELAAFRARRGLALSAYLDLDPAQTLTPDALGTRVNSLLEAAERREVELRADLTHEQLLALREDLERVGDFFVHLDREGVRGAAVFASSLDGLWRPLALAGPVEDAAWVDSVLHLAPLVPLADRGEGALVAVVGGEQGLLYRLRDGRLVEIADRSEELMFSRHDQGGWSQARYQRSVEKERRDHLRRVAGTLAALHRPATPCVVLAVHDEKTRAAFEDELPHDVRRSIAGAVHAPAHAGPGELLGLVEPVLERWRARREEEVVARWREELGRDGRATAGWSDTLPAASDGRVELLLYDPRTDRHVWRCPSCGRLAPDGGTCPLEGVELERRGDGIGLVLQQTLAHGGVARAVLAHREELRSAGGVGALLRF
ncbi:MAG TPA: Vms1/Ankzf1 family peptidyl-tRNA hydrolase [Gaiellaceae bacterium]|nr:Vms1/Ankzf1 family peptidyl-tRNA hydrolase [Gaiellaceae bacterium]